MTTTPSPRLGMELAVPGSGEPFSTAKVNEHFLDIDAAVGAPDFPSTARPSTPFPGQVIYEPDSGQFAVYSPTAGGWAFPGGARTVADLAGLPLTHTEGVRIHVDAMQVDFQSMDGVWVQTGPSRVADAAARDTEYAKASGAYRVQGALVLTVDTGIVWSWYAAYNAGSNPTGAKAAGWYPTALGLPLGGRQVRSAAAQSFPAGGATILAAAFWSETLAGGQKAVGIPVPFATNNGWTAPLEGMYEVELHHQGIPTTNPYLIAITKNNAAASIASSVVQSSAGVAASLVSWVFKVQIPLAAGDIIRAVVVSNSIGNSGTTPDQAAFGIRFLEPLRQ